jgi:hypothetical protein
MAGNHRCIGGLIDSQPHYDNYLNGVRLLNRRGDNFGSDVGFEVGQFWDVQFSYSDDTEAPHTEDVHVYEMTYERDCDDLAAYLRDHQTRLDTLERWWEGSPDTVFQGKIRATPAGSGFISREDVPSMSTGFWVPDRDLDRRTYDEKVRYRYGSSSAVQRLPYVGERELPSTIPAGTICRVSLARWWSKDSQTPERCYLQLSDAYLSEDSGTDGTEGADIDEELSTFLGG